MQRRTGAVWSVLLVGALAPGAGAQADAAESMGLRSYAFSDAARLSLEPDGGPPAEPSGTYSVNLGFEPRTLNNLLRADARSNVLCRTYLYPPLLEVDGDLEIVPETAAARPESRDGGRVWRWTLRRGILWHEGDADGNPVEVTTADVQYAWDMMHDADVPAQTVRSKLDRFTGLRVIDSHTFDVTLDAPYFRAELDFGVIFRLMPAHLCPRDAESFASHPIGRAPVGYGPYRFESWEPGLVLTLVRNPEYQNPHRPFHHQRLRFLFVRDTDKVMSLFLRGDLSVCTIDDPDRWEAAKHDPKVQEAATFHEYFLPRFNFIGWNHRHWAFSDRRVRQAMTHLYPRQRVADKFYRGYAQVVSGPWAFLSPEYDHDVEPLAFDPARARALLQEAGFRDDDRDGVLERDGKPFRFTLLRSSTRVPAMEKGARLFQYELKKVGIQMEVQPLEFNTLLTKLRGHEFDAAQLGWSSNSRDDDLHAFLHSSAANGGHNYPSYDSDACDALLETYRTTMDVDERRGVARRIHRLLRDEHPITFLPTPQSLLLVSTRHRNVSIRRRGALMHEWWMEPAGQSPE